MHVQKFPQKSWLVRFMLYIDLELKRTLLQQMIMKGEVYGTVVSHLYVF